MPLRLGILGTAQIVPAAVIKPARLLAECDVVAIASRDSHKAKAFAQKHQIARHYEAYEDLLADDEVDAVYLPLPISLHCEWAVRALDAGKHVLCEKPLASNAEEAQQMEAAAKRNNRLLMEAFHYRYHPFAQAIQEVLQSGVLGTIRHIEACLSFPILSRRDFRYRYEMGGGALMDIGCYPVNFLRLVAGAEPNVVGTQVKLASPKIDRWMGADLQFDDGRTGRITCSMLTPRFIHLRCKVIGDDGRLVVVNPYGPHLFNILRVDTKTKKQRGMQPRGQSTYYYQLQAFARAVSDRESVITSAEDAVKNLQLIDAIYRHAGLPPRGLSDY